MSAVSHSHALRNCVIATAILAMVFLAWPRLDLLFSGLFYDPNAGFWLADLPLIQHLREGIWKLIVLGALGALAALAFTKTFRSTTPVLNKVWEVICLLYLLGPALLVDVILKGHWGRARPANVTEFGGTADFSQAFVLTDQCAKNCSFVSGEGSGVTALLIGVLLVIGNQSPRPAHKWIKTTAFVVAALGLSLRIIMGRHFLSDTIFAALFVTIIALALLCLPRYRTLKFL